MPPPDLSAVGRADGTRRAVGRPRQFGDEDERRLIFDAAYAALRDHGRDFTVANVLAAAGVATRSFYRHFASKDALLCAMYRRDAQWAAERLTERLTRSTTPVDAVRCWIDELFSFVGDPRRAERVAVLGSITVGGPAGVEAVAVEGRQMLIEPLCSAISEGITSGVFAVERPDTAAELVSAAVMHAAGLAAPYGGVAPHDQVTTTTFCLRALGTRDGST